MSQSTGTQNLPAIEQKASHSETMALPEKYEAIRVYWNEHIHDLAVARHPIGTREFFKDLEEYRFDKLRYLPKVVNFSGYAGKKVLEIGCGIGLDLARFAASGAIVTGVDLSETAIELARKNFELQGLKGNFLTMNGEDLNFPNNAFDVVYAHGVLQYTPDPHQMAQEMFRVLRPGGEAIAMVYNRISWLNALSKVMKVKLEHEDAPVLRKYSIREFKQILSPFPKVKIKPERFPVKSKLHKGWKGAAYNYLFVPSFKIVPRPLIRPLGWHLMAFAYK